MHSETALLGRYAPDLTRDPVHVWLSKYHWIPITTVGFLQIAIGTWATGHFMGGITMMLWGTFLRVVVGLHATWLVNSVTHLFGSRRFETRDDSRNSWWVALLTGGEGWHNNHHAHPVSARHGLAWYEMDINYYCIWALSKLGLAEKIQIAKFDPNAQACRQQVLKLTGHQFEAAPAVAEGSALDNFKRQVLGARHALLPGSASRPFEVDCIRHALYRRYADISPDQLSNQAPDKL